MQISIKYCRRETSNTYVRGLGIGSNYPIRIQTMANVSTNDIENGVAQTQRCIAAGAEIVRFTTQGIKEVESLSQIRKLLGDNSVPLVADVHFRSDVADAAALAVDKVRINPGNYANSPEQVRERFLNLLSICKAHQTALRIGVNHGSLSERIMSQYGDTPKGMVESCMEFLRLAKEANYDNLVLSIKASNTKIMVETVRLLVMTMDKEGMHYPLHLGVTEAGEGEDGRIKSAVGIGALLADGIGDTIRVSLSEEPEAEIPVAKELVNYFVDINSPRYNGNKVDIENGVLIYHGIESEPDTFALHAAAECGRLLWDYQCNDLLIYSPDNTPMPNLAKDILQAARIRMYKTEYVSCPGCGRTMFNLQQTVAKIKAATADMQGLKIGIMGCIVNGPGEMADADYGYVGAGRDRISLYRGKECILKNIPQTQAVEELLKLIKQDKQKRL